MTRRMAATVYLLASTFSASWTPGIAEATQAQQVVKISARRYEFQPTNITLRKGSTTVLRLTTEDRVHGFNIPAMNVRADIVPGKVTEVTLLPQKQGDFEFFCDIFCGSGHEDMRGKITVVE